ncbi:hypothetical protein Tco_1006276 [Tanacetum coccineum]|uniref:Uncharacterized protein n=1 Tax=Tanacetum coccineum TaxID=301880 RepID=A0ABQ5FHI2_9ASTR
MCWILPSAGELPPSGDTVIDFVNELGYPEPVEIVSSIRVNYVYQPWRAILSLLNQCLTGKTSGSDKPRHPVLQMLWGIVTQTNVDHAELIWEEFTQGIQTFFSHKASHKASLKNPKKKVTPLLIPYGRFSKVIIYYLASNNNIHRRPASAVHHTGDDYILGNLKFVPKGESVEVYTKENPLKKGAALQPATKRATPKKPTTTTPVKQSKPAPPPTKKPSKRKLPQKKGNDPDLERAKKMSLEALQEQREGEGDDAPCVKAHEALAGPNPEPMKEKTRLDQTMENYICLIFKPVTNGHPPQQTRRKLQHSPRPLPEITPFIALQLRVARLEQEISEVKKSDHSADVLASIRSQVPTAVDNYLGTKLDDALLKLKMHGRKCRQVKTTRESQDSDRCDDDDDDEGP